MNLIRQGVPEELSQFIVDYIEEVKELLSSDLWENVFLNCSKNEVLIFWLLYRREEVNMTEVADYIHVPLNTATGIINRMEKNGFIVRTRSTEDRRVVHISFSEKGAAQFDALLSEMMRYGLQVVNSLTGEEMDLLRNMTAKVLEVLRQEKQKEAVPKKIRKIEIE